MGASFIGRDYSVYTTTGGFIELMRALITLGERMPQTPDLVAVLAFLRNSLELVEQDKLLEQGKLSKSMLYIERAEILSSLGDKYGELTAWQQAALSEPDIETRSILEEIVADLEVQLKIMKTQD